MKNAIRLFIMSLLLCLSASAYAQAPSRGSHIVDARLDLKATEFQGAFIIINYEIPYSGVVEIRLFNEAGQKVWQNQYPDTFGPNKIVMKASKFNPGETYSYQLNYKRDEVKNNLVIPPLGFE